MYVSKLFSHVPLCNPMDCSPARLLFPWNSLSRQEYWSGSPFSSVGDLPHPGIKPRSPALQADSLPTELGGKPLDECSIYEIKNISRNVTPKMCILIKVIK